MPCKQATKIVISCILLKAGECNFYSDERYYPKTIYTTWEQFTVSKGTLLFLTMVAEYMPITSSFPPMFTQTSNVTNNLAVSLLTHYSFDLGGYSASELVKRWENQYPSNWVHLAIIEALYQGRYKAVSAQQILTLWLRRNHPSYHFNMEFERLICNKLPEDLKWNNSLPPLPPALPSVGSSNPTIEEVMRNHKSSNSSYYRNLETEQVTQKPVEEDYHTVESASARAEEDSRHRNPSKILPSSTSMVFVPRSQSETSIPAAPHQEL